MTYTANVVFHILNVALQTWRQTQNVKLTLLSW